MRILLLFAATGLTLCAASNAQKPARAPYADVETACKKFLEKAPEIREAPGRFKANCDSSAFYFGIGRPRDFVAARRCAFAESASLDASDVNMFLGPGVLSMLYANGEGVPRNTAVARGLVCEIQHAATAETSFRLALLDEIDHAPKPPHFDLCQTATSGLSQGSCQDLVSSKARVVQTAQIAVFTAHLAPAAKAAFMALQKAETEYESTRSENEVDLSGTAREALALQDQDDTAKQFLADLSSLQHVPPEAHPSVAQADTELNSAYASLRKVLSAATGSPDSEHGTVTFAGVQQTERSWLKLRDRWTEFLSTAYPSYPKDAFLARLIAARTKQLHSLLQPAY